MAFQTPITIKEAIKNIQDRKYLLPAIQREFVWKSEQIENLFDSLMNDYPIGSFLFWEVKNPKDYKLYKFIQKYDQRESSYERDEMIELLENEEKIAILDGQQRLTSLYIGLLGTYIEKLPYYRWDSPKAFPEKFLCLNLLDGNSDEDKKYEFKFCTQAEIENKTEKYYWFKIKDILDIEYTEIFYVITDLFYGLDKEILKKATEKLTKLYDIINRKPIINFYLEKENDLDKVLNIFIRINSAGTKLNYSDLLLSIATAQWSGNAREKMNKLVADLNKIGNGFDLDKDFILKAGLYLTEDIKSIKFKVNNFKKKNIDLIEQNWDNIEETLNITINLLKVLGYDKTKLSSNIPILPITLYILKNNIGIEIVNSSKYIEDRELIKEWIIKSTLKRIFSGTENVLKSIRGILLEKTYSKFPLDIIKEKLKTIPSRSIIFTEDDIENLLWYGYRDVNTFSILQLLYPTLDYRNIFHIDHIYPKAKLTPKYLKKFDLVRSDLIDNTNEENFLANLQLLEGTLNLEKNDKEPEEWINSQYKSNQARKEYLEKNYIPENIELTITNYEEFFRRREELILEKLKEILLEK